MHGEGPVERTSADGRRVVAVVLAGGSGTRFGAAVSKVYVPLGGRPILAYALEVLDAAEDVDDVVVVIREGDEPDLEALLIDLGGGVGHGAGQGSKVRAVVVGGQTRQGSEWAGIEAVRDRIGGPALVLLHDGARPFLTHDVIAALVDVTSRSGVGALPARPLGGDLADASGRAIDIADLVAVQTPQAFDLEVLLATYPHALEAGFDGVDTAQTVQAFSDCPVHWVAGDERNLKITHPADLSAAEALIPLWAAGRWIEEV